MTISTSSAPKYWESTFLTRRQNFNQEFYYDALSDEVVDLLNSITRYHEYTVQEGDKLTTVCYEYYDTTSLYYLILYYNGLFFWDEVQPGEIIRIPHISDINAFFGLNRQQVSQEIRI